MLKTFKFASKERVRYQHIDMQGVVYNSRYVDFLESGRMEYFRNLGITSKNMITKGYDFLNVRLYCNFVNPACLDEVILIYTRLAWIRNSSFGFYYVLKEKEENTILTTASTAHVMVNSSNFQPIRIPNEYRVVFKKFEGNDLKEYGPNEKVDLIIPLE